jgi:hypothetical protein
MCLKTQYTLTIERWTVASKCDLITHWHGVISQKKRISTCVLHLSTGKPLTYLIWGMPLCADLCASLRETCEYNHKTHTLKTASIDGLLRYVKTFKRFALFINGWKDRRAVSKCLKMMQTSSILKQQFALCNLSLVFNMVHCVRKMFTD